MREARIPAVFAALVLTAAAASAAPPLPVASANPSSSASAAVATMQPLPAASLSPEGIYLRAVKAMKAESLPAYVIFDEAVTARNVRLNCSRDGLTVAVHHGDVTDRYHVWYRVSDAAVVAREAVTAKPCGGTLLFPAGSVIASLGAPTAAPSSAPSPVASGADVSGGAGPALIAAVRVESARYYQISLAGRESFEGHDCYRLGLRAYRDPNLHPLTELIVDAGSFLVRRAMGDVSIHLVLASGRAAGTIVFDREGAYWVVRDEDFELAFNALFMHARSDVSVRGSAYAYADALPEVAFPTPSPSPSVAPSAAPRG